MVRLGTFYFGATGFLETAQRLGLKLNLRYREAWMTRFPCPHLNAVVELTEERERHIAERHPDLLPEHRQRVAEVLADPDQIRRSARFARAKLFSRWYTDVQRGRHVVVVVVSDPGPRERHWIITSYLTMKLVEGELEWTRS